MHKLPLLAAGAIALASSTMAAPASSPQPEVDCIPAPVSIPTGWALLDAHVAVHASQTATYTWDGAQYVYGLSTAGNIVGDGLWAFVTQSSFVQTPAYCPELFEGGFFQPDRWRLLGNPASVPVQVIGPEALWVYDQVNGYQRTDILAPGQGAWAISSHVTRMLFQRVGHVDLPIPDQKPQVVPSRGPATPPPGGPTAPITGTPAPAR